MRRLKQWLLAGVLGWLAGAAMAVTVLPLYTHYDEPPFGIEEHGSLTLLLADFLTRESAGVYRFVPQFMPRKRLEGVVMQQPGWQGVVAWASRDFFLDPDNRYLWSDSYLSDRSLVLSNRNRPVDYQDARSLHGLTVGAVLGRFLTGFEEDIKAGKIRRDDAPGNTQNLHKLKLGRIDVVLLTEAALPYYRREFPDLDSWLYIAPKVRSVTHRQLVVSQSDPALLAYLNRALRKLPQDPAWRATLQFMRLP